MQALGANLVGVLAVQYIALTRFQNRIKLPQGGRRFIQRNTRVQMVHNMCGHGQRAPSTQPAFKAACVFIATR